MPPLLLLLPLSASQLDPSQQHFNMLRSLPNQNKSRTKLPCLAAIPLSVLLTARFVGSAAYTFRLCSPMSPLAPQTIRFGFRPISLQDGLTPTLCPLNTAPPHFSLHRQLCNSLWLTKAPPHPISSSWPPGRFQCQQREHVTFHAFLLHVHRSTYVIRMCIYGFFSEIVVFISLCDFLFLFDIIP